jgi:diphthamide synthase (EF-2-diphthine--ammonia ligase)
VFGDLFLEDVRTYREQQLAALDMKGIFPLWQRDTAEVAGAIVDTGIVAHVVCLDPKKLDPRFAGRRFDLEFLRDLPSYIDPCGENGEFHTVVIDGPMFSNPVGATVGSCVERDGFVFADVK